MSHFEFMPEYKLIYDKFVELCQKSSKTITQILLEFMISMISAGNNALVSEEDKYAAVGKCTFL